MNPARAEYLLARVTRPAITENPAGVGSTTGAAQSRFRIVATGALAFQRTGGTAVSPDLAPVGATPTWLRGVNDISEVTPLSIKTSLGASETFGGVDAGTPGLNTASICARISSGTPDQFSIQQVNWWFGYDRNLTAPEKSAVEAHLNTLAGI